MFRKRSLMISLITFLIVSVFSLGYILTLNKYGFYKDNKGKNTEAEEQYTIISNVDKVLSSNVNIALKLKLLENNKEHTVKEFKLGEIQNEIDGKLTLRNVESYFSKQGYKLAAGEGDELTFIKDSKCEPGKYYIGINADGFITVLKCDGEGNLTIEDPVEDISNKKLDILPQSEQESITNFKYKYDSKDEAMYDFMSIIT